MKKSLFSFLIAIAMVIGGLALTVPVSKVSASDECPTTAEWVLDTEWYANPDPDFTYHDIEGDAYGYYCPDGESTPVSSATMTASPTMPVSATPSSTAVSTVVKTEEPTLVPTEVNPTGQPTDEVTPTEVLPTAVPTEEVTATQVTPTNVSPTGEPTNEVTPTEVLPTAVPTEEVTATEPPRCDGDCPTATVIPTIVPTIVVSQTPPPTGGGACATSNFVFSVGESLVAFWTDSSAQLKGWIIVTEKGELVIQFANGDRNSGELKVQNLDGSKTQIVEVGATGCNPPKATATITPKSVSTPVPVNADTAAIKLKVDCTGYASLTFDGTKFDYSRAVYTDSSGNHGLIFSPATGGWAARIPLRNEVLSVTAWVVDSKNSLITVLTTVDFTDCARPGTELKVVVIPTPAPTPNPFSEDRAAITLNVGVAGLSKDPGIVLFPNGQKFESMWLVTDTYRVQLDTWTNDLPVCQNLILANFEYLPVAGETAEIDAIMVDNYVVRTAVQTSGNGSDVNCSNLMKSGDAWLGHWYGGNTYQSWYSFLGYTGSLEKFVGLMEEARGKSHAEIFELPKAVIDSSSIFSNNE